MYNQALPIKEENPNEYVYYGFPDTDFVRQICFVVELWFKRREFLIKFQPMPAFTDETDKVVEQLKEKTSLVDELL